VITLDPLTQQNLSCTHCGEVTLADGTKVWVCKSCGQPNDPATVAAQPADTPAAPYPEPVIPASPTPVVPTEPVAPVSPAPEVPGTDTTPGQ